MGYLDYCYRSCNNLHLIYVKQHKLLVKLNKTNMNKEKKKMATVAFIGISAAIITIGIRGMIWIWNPDA